MSDWISFAGYPPIEMLLRPYSNDPSAPFSLYQEEQCADFIGRGQSSLPLDPSSAAVTDVQESSSSLTNHQDPSCRAPVGIPLISSSEVADSSPNGGSTEYCLDVTPLKMEVMKEEAKAKGTTMTAKAMKVVGSGQRSSVFRGVTRHRWTGRYEAHLWDNTCRREGQKRKGRQVYLGGYDKEEKAARAYDLAALKYWGPSATTNFPVDRYYHEIEIMQNMTKQEFIASIRRNSSGFSRGASVYRGVTRHHQQGRWQARIGRVAGNKDLYLGTFGTEAEAAEAYDVAAIKFRGCNAVTNFALSRYNVEAIANSELPVGTSAKRMEQQKALQPKTSITAITSTEPSTRALPERTKQSTHGNNSPLLTITSVNKTICNWATGNFQTNAAPQQTTLESCNALGHPINDPLASVHSLFQLQSSTVDQSSVSLAYYNMDDASSDSCGQNFYWPLVSSQHTRQVHCGTLAEGTELLRLAS